LSFASKKQTEKQTDRQINRRPTHADQHSRGVVTTTTTTVGPYSQARLQSVGGTTALKGPALWQLIGAKGGMVHRARMFLYSLSISFHLLLVFDNCL